jgi:hypothetical protein
MTAEVAAEFVTPNTPVSHGASRCCASGKTEDELSNLNTKDSAAPNGLTVSPDGVLSAPIAASITNRLLKSGASW